MFLPVFQDLIKPQWRAVATEQRMIEQLLGTQVIRRELPGGRTGQPCVVFDMAAA